MKRADRLRVGLAVLVLGAAFATVAASSGDSHCGVRVLGVQESGQFDLSEMVCFGDHRDLVRFFEGGDK